MLTACQIARALGVTKGRVYRALSRPYPLPYITASLHTKAGGQQRYYAIGVILPRLKMAFDITPEQIKVLIREGPYNA